MILNIHHYLGFEGTQFVRVLTSHQQDDVDNLIERQQER